MSWLHPAGSLSSEPGRVSVTPELAGWEYCGLDVYELGTVGPIRQDMDGVEGVLVPLSARDVSVEVDGEHVVLAGREGVFAAVSDSLYVPSGSELRITGTGGEIALCTARTNVRHPVAYLPANQVEVEVRGAGRATRQITNIATATSFAGAEKILVCEVLTPGGNLSSWPPHRHDGIGECVVSNEEIYYFRIGKLDSPHGDPEGNGLFRVYTVDGSTDETVNIRDGDVYVVPQGYHGPSAALPEYPMYFLNVLAGPGAERTMAYCDDPSHHWIRQAWAEQEQDPRCPMTSAGGRVVAG